MENKPQDIEYNRRLAKLSENYLALFKLQMQEKLDKFKSGAWNIANISKNPELKKVCEELDKIELS